MMSQLELIMSFPVVPILVAIDYNIFSANCNENVIDKQHVSSW